MFRLLRFVVLIALLVPVSASAETYYPTTLLDQSCTDSFDTPAAPAAATLAINEYRQKVTQVSGSADNLCDHDPRIVTGALTADTDFGPFVLPPGADGFYLRVDADTVTGGDTDWRIMILLKIPHDGALTGVDATSDQTGAGNVLFTFGSDTTANPGADTEQMDAPIPAEYYVRLDFVAAGATSITADISMVASY
jgi:hypothetical protein